MLGKDKITYNTLLKKYQKKLNIQPITIDEVLIEFNNAVENGIGSINVIAVALSTETKTELNKMGFLLRPFDENGIYKITISLI